ncbi:hypothetical protein SAMN04488522_103729 [Pedobacter caeni]|uniref:Uncharacterized protein n=2 Tax=Pedobacter caeni TaxID=288992 RepID=A0A1M5EP36_9SPHI|nr:hypothetical protein SAMN04488522_103729 [Pedobacter caeni]
MNQEDIFKKIGLILDELQDQYQYLAQNPKQLNELELELFMANASFLSDHVQIVRKLNSAKVVKEIPEHTSAAQENVEEKVTNTWSAEEPQAISVPVVVAANAEAVTTPSSNHQEEWFNQVEEIKEEITEELSENEVVAETTAAVELKEETAGHSAAAVEPQEAAEEPQVKKVAESPMERELFKLDKEPSTFEFILKDVGATDQFEFEEKSVDEIFDRPLSKEEEEVIAQKQRIKEQEARAKTEIETADELGPEPFLVEREEDVVPLASTQLVLDDFERKEVQVEIPAPEVPVAAAYSAVESYKREEPVQKVEEVVYKAEEPVHKVEEPVQPVQKTEESARPTLNEILARQNGTNINTDNSRNAITDLKQGINMNDKMLYIKDLFNGYNLAYAEVIDLLNKMPDFKTADSFLQNNYAAKNNWASRQATVDKFYELLNQRFQAK